MEIDWENVLQRLRLYPESAHRILPPAPPERIEVVEKELGSLPIDLLRMLAQFNGAKLFIKSGPMLSLFGISSVPPLPRFEWAPSWHLDKYTPTWRTAMNCSNDWVIAMTNYGGLMVLDSDGLVREFDTGERQWSGARIGFDKWIDQMLQDGAEFYER